MPTTPGAALASESLDPKAAQAKFAGLIKEIEPDEVPAPAVEEPAEQPAPPETPPPAEPSDSEPPADPEEVLHDVPVDGKPVQVSLAELKSSYSYKEHNTRAAQANAERERALEAESQAIKSERQRYQQGITDLADALAQLQAEPNWDELRAKEPGEYLRQKADYEYQQSNIRKLREEAERTKQRSLEAEQQEQLKRFRLEQDRLGAAVPEWKDPDAWRAAIPKLVATAKRYGFTEAEIGTWADHRYMLLLRDAEKYAELHREPAPATKAKVPTIKPAKPGSPERPRPNAAQERLIDQARKSGRQRDAMAAIMGLMGPND